MKHTKLASAFLLTTTFVLSACSGAKSAVDDAADLTSDLSPQPAMWVVSDADSEITLYPTIHILPQGVTWQTPEMTERLMAADEVWFEIEPGSDSDPTLQQYIMSKAMDPSSPLSEKLEPELYAQLETQAAALAIPVQAIAPMQPWMAGITLGMMGLVKEGYDPASGVEMQLTPMVEGKTVRSLETAQSQIEMLANLSPKVQIEFLRSSIEDMEEGKAMVDEMVKDWAVGDVDDLEEDLIQETKDESPELYDAMFVNRNKNWAKQIAAEMEGSGTDFIAVGAGHLVGEDGVPQMLRDMGYKVNRL